MENEIKTELDNIYNNYLTNIRLGEFKYSKGSNTFEKRYEKLKNDLIYESKKHIHSDSKDVFNYINSLVDRFKSLCYGQSNL